MAHVNFKLVTIICEPVLSKSLIAMIRLKGASGFTMTDVRGEGSGKKRSGEVPDEKVKIEVVVDADLANKLMQEIAKDYFQNYALIVYGTDIEIVRPNKF